MEIEEQVPRVGTLYHMDFDELVEFMGSEDFERQEFAYRQEAFNALRQAAIEEGREDELDG